MKSELYLKIQACLDGELTPEARVEMADLLAVDPNAQALFAELKSTKNLLHGNELAFKLPATKDFFWSRIEQEIARLDPPLKTPSTPAYSHWWWKLLAPAGALALFVCVLLPLRPHFLFGSALAALSGMEVETTIPDSSIITFRSEAEGVTVVWVDTQ